ncbi:MAG: hypothetical protein AAGC60_03280 [Acidobacteriota bacterium]
MDLEALVWLIFIVIWLLGGVVKQFARLAANRPGQQPPGEGEAELEIEAWEPEPERGFARRDAAEQPIQPPAPPADRPPEMPPLLGELMKQLGVEVEAVPEERPRAEPSEALGDRRTPSEHRRGAGWRERTASEHERGPGWQQRTASEQRRTASEHRRTASEQRRTASEHQLTASEHTPSEGRPRRRDIAAVGAWGVRRTARRHPVVDTLHDRDSLVRAFLAHEILGPPRALRREDQSGG